MAHSETVEHGNTVEFPFEELYQEGTGWRKFIKSVFSKRFVGENFRVRMFTQKEKRNAVASYDLAFLVLWHLTEMEYQVESPSIYDVAKRLEHPDWQQARLVLINITGVSRDKKKLRIKFFLG